MGCHTWYYTKSPLTYADAKRSVIDNYTSEINSYQSYLDGTADAITTKIVEDTKKSWFRYYNKPMDIERYISSYKRKIRLIEKGLCKNAVCERFTNTDTNDSVKWHAPTQTFYWDRNVKYHDVWRCYGYPDDKLFSWNETKTFIRNNIDKCKFGDFIRTIRYIKKFWDDFPDGMICFG